MSESIKIDDTDSNASSVMLTKGDDEIVLMFSGGLYSTLAACLLAKQYKRIHLVTFQTGLFIRISSASNNVRELRAKFGQDKFLHRIIYAGDLFANIRKDVQQYFKKYKSPLPLCLCCCLTLEAAAVIYCLENNIHIAADASISSQDLIVLWHPDYVKMIDKFFKDYGIVLIHPSYDSKSRSERISDLERLRIYSGIKFFEKFEFPAQLFNQPFCLWDPISFLFTSGLMRKFPIIRKYNLDLEAAVEFRRNREEIARDYI